MRNTFCHIPSKNKSHTLWCICSSAIAPSSGDSAQLHLQFSSGPANQK